MSAGPLARAQTAPADTARYRLAPVEVTAVRGATPAALETARAVVLTRADADAAGATTVADLLERRGGAFVKPYGPTGLASLSLRGTGASSTAVLLDGLRLNDPALGQIDLRLLPAALLNAVTVVHGAASAWHGADALGGALLLETPRAARALRASAEAGAWGTRRLNGLASGTRGRLAGTVAASADATDGDFAYVEPAFFPARRVRRSGADARFLTALATGRRAGARGVTTAGTWAAAAERGLPGVAGTTPQHERQSDALARMWAAHERPLGPGVGAGRARVAAYAQATRLRYENPALALDDVGRTRTAGVEAEAVRPAGPLALGAGLAYGYAHAAHPSLARAAHEHTASAFAHATHARGRLTATAAVRADGYFRAGARYAPVSPRVGVRLALPAGFAVKTSGGRSFRAPTLNDRYWRGAGRPDLRPERAWSADAGVAWTRGALDAEATGYLARVRDEIVWAPGADGVWRPGNVRRTATRGVELSARGACRVGNGPARLHGGVFAAFTRARDRSDAASPAFDRPLRYVPLATVRADAGLAGRRLSLDAGVQATGRRYVTADGSQALPPYALVDAALGVRLGALTLSARVENLFDAAYRPLEGYPMPGRHLRLRLAYAR